MSFDPGDLIGAVLNGNYRVERLIGRGGMGAVFEVTHLRLDHRFAAKLLSPSASADQELAARFDREAKLTAGLRHENIVEVTDFNRCEIHGPYLVMELLRGEDLGARLRRAGALSPTLAAQILESIAAALSVAHQRGIVHRDLKPGNVFLCDDGADGDGQGHRVKVLDFGVAKVLGASAVTQAGVRLGTSAFMSPEQAVGAEIDWRTDQFAAASLTYQMVTGRPPFVGDHDSAVLYQIEHKEPAPPDTVDPQLPEAISVSLRRAMRKEPKARYGSMRELAEAFSAAVGGDVHQMPIAAGGADQAEAATRKSTVGTSLEQANQRAGPPRRRRSSLGIGVALAAVVTLIWWIGPQLGREAKVALPTADAGRPTEAIDAARSAKAIDTAPPAIDATREREADARRLRPGLARPIALETRRPRRPRPSGLSRLQRACAEHKRAAACRAMGQTFARRKNAALAVAAYLRGCQLKDARSCLGLGRIYRARREEDAARFAFSTACDLGLGAGCQALGRLYRQPPKGGTPNIVRAHKYFARACQLRSAAGCTDLGRLRCPGGGLPLDGEICQKYLRLGCRLGDAAGCRQLKQKPWAQKQQQR